MKVTFIANGCAIYESNGFRLLSDPWLTDGAFEGSWFHYPPLKTRPADVADVDALYISHIHPDHFDPATLKAFRRDIPIVALRAGGGFLLKALERLGFTSVRGVAHGERAELGPLRCTLFGPLAKHHMHESAVGNLIDSAMLVDDGQHRVLNLNDNIPTVDAAAELARSLGEISMLQVQYCAAGPYPSCFDNLGDDGKARGVDEVVERYLRHFASLIEVFRPRHAMPFAGDFVIGGRQWRKNRFLGTTTMDHAARYVRERVPGVEPVLLNEGQTFDLATGHVVNGTYRPIDVGAQMAYIEQELSRAAYPHEQEQGATASLVDSLRERLPGARAHMWQWQQRLKCQPAVNIYIDLGSERLCVPFERPEAWFEPADRECEQPYLRCSMDLRLLDRILSRRAHWNNAEGGCHIDFMRVPDRYLPDVHTLLSFFHLPV